MTKTSDRRQRLRDVFNRLDVMGFQPSKESGNLDEYDPEIEKLEDKFLPGATAPDVSILLGDIFDEMFWEGAGKRDRFAELSREVLRVWEDPRS